MPLLYRLESWIFVFKVFKINILHSRAYVNLKGKGSNFVQLGQQRKGKTDLFYPFLFNVGFIVW